mgnify:CR=1 FL=1
MYNDQDNNYSTGGTYSSGYQGYDYGENRSYSYYEAPRPKKKKRVGKVIAIVLTACVVIGGSAVGGYYLAITLVNVTLLKKVNVDSAIYILLLE